MSRWSGRKETYGTNRGAREKYKGSGDYIDKVWYQETYIWSFKCCYTNKCYKKKLKSREKVDSENVGMERLHARANHDKI